MTDENGKLPGQLGFKPKVVSSYNEVNNIVEEESTDENRKKRPISSQADSRRKSKGLKALGLPDSKSSTSEENEYTAHFNRPNGTEKFRTPFESGKKP